MKRFVLIAISVLLVFLLTSCGLSDLFYIDSSNNKKTNVSEDFEDNFSKFDQNTDYDINSLNYITITDNKIDTTGNNISITNNTITIKSSGEYLLSGSSSNAKIIIDAKKTDKIHLIFNDLNLSSNNSSALYILSADKVSITLSNGSNNSLTDSNEYTYTLGEEEHFAAIYSKTDLTINGNGKLNIYGNNKNGITVKGNIKLLSSNITINSKNNGIKAKNIIIASGNVKINAENDGLKASNDDNGYILILGGLINISALDDGLQSDDTIIIKAGEITTNVVKGLQINSPKQKIAIGTIKK